MTHLTRAFVVGGVVVLGSFLVVSSASAQQCVGAASLNAAPLQVGAGFAFSSVTDHDLAGSFRGGHDNLFGSIGAESAAPSGRSASASGVTGGFGSELPSSGPTHLCSLAGVRYIDGPNGGGLNQHELDIFGGVALGIVAAETTSFAVVPTIGVGFQAARSTLTYGPLTIPANDTYGVARFGVGLVVHQQFAVTPTLIVPFAGGPSINAFSIAMTYNFAMR